MNTVTHHSFLEVYACTYVRAHTYMQTLEPSLQGFAKLLPQKVKVGGGGGSGNDATER